MTSEHGAPHMKRAAFRIEFGAPPASTVPGYQACEVGCVGGLGASVCAAKADPSKGATGLHPLCPNTQARNTSANIAACSAWVLGNRAGMFDSGGRTFSSGAALALPNFRDFFLLRDGRHSKENSRNGPGLSKTEAAQRCWAHRTGECAGGQCAHRHRRCGAPPPRPRARMALGAAVSGG